MRGQLGRLAGDIGPDDPHVVRDRRRHVDSPGLGHELRSALPPGQGVVAGDEERRCTARGHLIGELRKVRVIADRDAERQRTHPEHRHVAPGVIDRLTDGRMQLPVDAGDCTSMKDGCGVVKETIFAELRETQDRGRDVAREGSQDGVELTSSDGYREAGGIFDLIGQAAEDRFRTAKNLDTVRLGRPDARPNEVERDHRAGGEERSLIGGNLHASMIAQLLQRFTSYAVAMGGGAPEAEVYHFATIKTDKDDYAPGEAALITGTGWEPNSEVTLLFQEDPAVHDDYVLHVPTDTNGTLYWDQWSPEEHDLNVRFYLQSSREASLLVRRTSTD